MGGWVVGCVAGWVCGVIGLMVGWLGWVVAHCPCYITSVSQGQIC